MTCNVDKYASFVVAGCCWAVLPWLKSGWGQVLRAQSLQTATDASGCEGPHDELVLREVTGWSLTTPAILPSLSFYIILIPVPLSIYHSVCLPLPFPNDALALSFRSVDALTLISVINWQEPLHFRSLSLSLCHPLWSSSTLPLFLIMSIFFLAYPFIKHWLPFLICILLISCCQLTLVILFDFTASLFCPLVPLLLSTPATIWSFCQYKSLTHLIKFYLMANWASVL